MSEVDDRHLALAQKSLARLRYDRSTRAAAHLAPRLVARRNEISIGVLLPLALPLFSALCSVFGRSRNFVSCPRSFCPVHPIASFSCAAFWGGSSAPFLFVADLCLSPAWNVQRRCTLGRKIYVARPIGHARAHYHSTTCEFAHPVQADPQRLITAISKKKSCYHSAPSSILFFVSTPVNTRSRNDGKRASAGANRFAARIKETRNDHRIFAPNGSRKIRVYCGAGGAAGKRIRGCELVGTCYAIDGVDTSEQLRNTERDTTATFTATRTLVN